MHISDGILSGPVLIGGFAATAGLLFATMRHLDSNEIPKISVMTSVFFVADLVHVPMGVTSVHLILNGLAGVILGWRAFPAILLGVILQALLLGHGGATVIGINTLMLGGGALASFVIWQQRHRYTFKNREFIFAAISGAAAIAVSGLIMASAMLSTGSQFWLMAIEVLAVHTIIMVLEALVVGSCAKFLYATRPELLAGFVASPPIRQEKSKQRANM